MPSLFLILLLVAAIIFIVFQIKKISNLINVFKELNQQNLAYFLRISDSYKTLVKYLPLFFWEIDLTKVFLFYSFL